MNQQFEKWNKWLEDYIYPETTELVSFQYIFRKIAKMANENPTFQQLESFHWFIKSTYFDYAVMACRRQLKSDRKSVSFVRLLEDIIKFPEVMSRERFVNLYSKDMRTHASQIFSQRFSGACKDYIDPIIVQQNLCELKSHGGKIGKVEDFADKRVAHSDRRSSDSPTFDELDACIDCLKKFTQSYRFLFRGMGENDDLLMPGINEYWDETFRNPLILPDGS
ncbi:MAG: hypothetical protein OXN25_07225 [Candidatus Poribacteria bacterium]|nr:hypothetical protein [Candidatus Poribacteria bacterium]